MLDRPRPWQLDPFSLDLPNRVRRNPLRIMGLRGDEKRGTAAPHPAAPYTDSGSSGTEPILSGFRRFTVDISTPQNLFVT